MDREAWRAAVHGVTKGLTRLSDWTELSLTSRQARNATTWKLSGLVVQSKEKWGGGEVLPGLSPVDVHVSIISSSPREGREVDLSLPMWSGQDYHSTLEKYFQVSVQGGSFILKCHLPISDYFLYVQSLFGGSLTLSLLGGMWVSWPHSLILWGMSCASVTWFCS